MQFFDYTHLLPVPEGFQETQDANASVLAQPTGTLITWQVPDVYSLVLDYAADEPNVELIDMAAESDFLGQSVTAEFDYTFVDDDGQSYPLITSDDTAESMTWIDGALHPMVYKVSAHLPDHLVVKTGDPRPYDPAPNTSSDRAGAKYRFILFDSAGKRMPGVYVQERFEPLDPPEPGFKTNKSAAINPWTTVISPGAGQFSSDDNLFYVWPTGDTATRTFNHRFFAAVVKSGPLTDTTGGIDVGLWTMVFTAGKPGTATQTGN
jgi:hypothetical protein